MELYGTPRRALFDAIETAKYNSAAAVSCVVLPMRGGKITLDQLSEILNTLDARLPMVADKIRDELGLERAWDGMLDADGQHI